MTREAPYVRKARDLIESVGVEEAEALAQNMKKLSRAPDSVAGTYWRKVIVAIRKARDKSYAGLEHVKTCPECKQPARGNQ